MMGAQDDGVEVERELTAVELWPEMTLIHGELCGAGDGLDELALHGHEHVVWPAFPIVELDRRSDEEAAGFTAWLVEPAKPSIEQLSNPGLSARCSECGAEHGVLKASFCSLQDGDLQVLFGSEVGEKATLREPQVRCERADAEPFEPIATRELDGSVEDAFTGLFALRHGFRINTNGRAICQARDRLGLADGWCAILGVCAAKNARVASV